MSLILHIDTAIDTATVIISQNEHILAVQSNNEQKEHAAFIQPAIQALLKELSIAISKLDAVSVSAGPGSYTGLRVGMASAKGLCFALGKPLITVGSLEILAYGAIQYYCSSDVQRSALFCPMIDARRMEVFTAVYDKRMEVVQQPCAMILGEDSFEKQMNVHEMLFFGNGTLKWKSLCTNKNALFVDFPGSSSALTTLAYQKFQSKDFADLAYSEPFYLKEFFTNQA